MAEEKDEGYEKVVKTYDLGKAKDQIALFQDGLSDEVIQTHIAQHIRNLIDSSGIDNYEVMFLFDNDQSISSFHSNKIYQVAKDLDGSCNILLIIQSGGGSIEPAYLISKTCKRLSKEKFNVAIPRKAKSAATLIALGANEIHMGLLSELGPIDPQFGGFPALGLSNAMEKIAAMSEKYPKASDMFAKYLTENINIQHLGLFERINESATQYATRLLEGRELPHDQTPEALADHFTNHYKDHSFVIDADEASTLLGNKVVKEGTAEYELGNAIYEFLEFFGILFVIFRNKNMRYVGSIDDGLDLNDRKD